MSASITVTGTAGPGNTVTAGLFVGCSEFTINPDKRMLSFTQDGIVKHIAISAATTMTVTIGADNLFTVEIA